MAASADLEQLGIRVITTAAGIEVSSASLILPWRARAGRVPGTAVQFAERLWEVVGRLQSAEGERFELRPWSEGEAIRHAARLDPPTIRALTEARLAAAKRQRQDVTLRLLLPLVGLLPARLLERWEMEHGMIAHRAVIASAVLELAFAVLAPIQVVSIIFHDPVLSGRWGWIAVVAAAAGAEAIARLAYLRTTRHPIGSIVTVPLRLLLPREAPKTEAPPVPSVAALDPATGVLDLGCAILRPDWHEGGVLQFRGRRYRLVGLRSHAAPWVYRFEALPEPVAPDLPRLGLTPPAPPLAQATPKERVSIVGDAFRMTAFSFAPGELQREWALANDLPLLALTIGCAGLELIGGIYNLAREGTGQIVFALLDLFFIGEGALRLALVALNREPCGSVFGAPFHRTYLRWLSSARDAATRAG